MSKGMYLIIQAIIWGLTLLYVSWKLSGTELFATISPAMTVAGVLVMFTTLASWKAPSGKQLNDAKQQPSD